MQQETFNWRAFLGEITRDPQERQRLAEIMGVSPITLTRWVGDWHRAQTTSEREKLPHPQIHSLRKLVSALPDYRDKLIYSILQELPGLSEEDLQLYAQPNSSEELVSIPVSCYEKVLEDAVLLSGELRFTTILDHLLYYALQQLDRDRLGFSATVLKCVQPQPGYKVRSLQELFRIGTPPWSVEHEERLFFRGAESLAGRAVVTGRPYEISNVNTYSGWLPVAAQKDEKAEVSTAVCPVIRTGRVAGCLSFSSTQVNYFTLERMQLIQRYGHLSIEAFNEVDFYSPQEIELRLMPDEKAQMPFLSTFNKRVQEVLAQGKITNLTQAIQRVLHLIENELINSTITKEKRDS